MGNARADIPVPALRTPPLGNSFCPYPRYNAGRALVLSGPQTFLGAFQVLTAWAAGQPASSVGFIPPPVIPSVPEGSVPFATINGVVVLAEPPADPGATAFADEV